MLTDFSPIFVVEAKIILEYNLRAPLIFDFFRKHKILY